MSTRPTHGESREYHCERLGGEAVWVEADWTIVEETRAGAKADVAVLLARHECTHARVCGAAPMKLGKREGFCPFLVLTRPRPQA